MSTTAKKRKKKRTSDVVERVWVGHVVANKNDISIWVGQRAKTVVIFLASCIPKAKLDVFARVDIDDVGDVIFKDSRDVG